MQKAGSISRAASNAAATAEAIYTKNGGDSDTLSKLFGSTIDKKVGDSDKVRDKDKDEDKSSGKTSFKSKTDSKKRRERLMS